MSQVTHPKNFRKFSEVTCHKGSVQIGPGHGHRGPNLIFFSHINTVSLWLHLCFFWFLMSTTSKNFWKSQVMDDLSERSSLDRDVTGHTLFELIEMVQYLLCVFFCPSPPFYVSRLPTMPRGKSTSLSTTTYDQGWASLPIFNPVDLRTGEDIERAVIILQDSLNDQSIVSIIQVSLHHVHKYALGFILSCMFVQVCQCQLPTNVYYRHQ